MTSHEPKRTSLRHPGLRVRIALIALVVLGSNLLPPHTIASDKGNTDMSPNNDCTDNAVSRSRCIIEAILKDIGETYTPIGGGGISSINQDATWVYTVSISQEERVDLITYTVEMSPDGEVIIKDRKTDTKSYGR